jgi:hypothetical protein
MQNNKPSTQMTVIAVIAATLLLFVHSAAAQQALSPLHPCGHGHQPPCPPPPPPPSPTPVGISFDPAMPSIPDNTAIGTPIVTISVRMSDGSQFNGSLGFGSPYGSDGGICAIQGMQVLLGAAPLDGVQNCTITATQ